jgi:hypothetical protein
MDISKTFTFKGSKFNKALELTNANQFAGSFVYHIHFLVPLTIGCSDDALHSLQSLMRSLINGKQTMDGIHNRGWFASSFSGGLYKISITQNAPEVFPIINYQIIAFSTKNNLQETMPSELLIRLQKNIPNIELKNFQMKYCDKEGLNKLQHDFEKINSESGFHFLSPPVRSLPYNYIKWMYKLMHQEEISFGEVYRRMHLSYIY